MKSSSADLLTTLRRAPLGIWMLAASIASAAACDQDCPVLQMETSASGGETCSRSPAHPRPVKIWEFSPNNA